MLRSSLLALLAGLMFLGLVAAECPNACSGHGDCGKYDMCTCWHNWQAADCSQRTCPFALAHVDTPKGDLNHDNSISAPATTVISGSTVYPYGTTEEFPAMLDSTSTEVTQSAHYYMECANKGLCNRKTGECECFEGYDGNACQRASCANDCSGHGVCKTIQQLATADNTNVYELWDQHSTMGCECDAGYYGADCSLRRCKYGVDPLFCTADNKPRYPQWTFQFSKTSMATGTYAIVFYDASGEDWQTDPITLTPNSDNCAVVEAALEALPNTVIPADSITCNHDATATSANALEFTVTFGGNPGDLKQPELNLYLEGSSATLDVTTSYVFPETSVSGEWTDAVPTHCSSVLVQLSYGAGAVTSAGNTLADAAGTYPLISFSADRTGGASELKACLGDSNGDTTDNVDVENWDHGAQQESSGYTDTELVWPHLVKFVAESATTAQDAVLGLLFYDNTASNFRLSSRFLAEDVAASSDLEIFTTDSTVQLVYNDVDSDDIFEADNPDDEGIIIYAADGSDSQYDDYFYTLNATAADGIAVDTSCENNLATLSTCLEKGDQIVLHNANLGLVNAVNLFTITRIMTEDMASATDQTVHRIDLDRTMPHDYHGGHIYKYTAGSEPYTYVSECSGRGTCNEEDGMCECFRGYTGDDCATQSSFAT